MQAQNTQVKEKKALTISELAHLHLTDQNHTTTDEELRNAKVELTSSEDIAIDEENLFEVDNSTVFAALSDESENKKENEDGRHRKNESSLPNPYDVLR